MFAPRIITLLLGLACASIAMLVAQDILTLPLELLKWIVAGTTSFFSLSALVMWFGLTDARRAIDGELVFGGSRRGRMMRWIRRWFVLTNEPHCCDVYIGTSMSTFVALGISYVGLLFIYGWFVVPLDMLAGVLIMAAFMGILFLAIKMEERGWPKWVVRLLSPFSFECSEKTARILKYIGEGLLWTLIIVAGGLMLFAWIYMPIEALIRLGYTWLGAIALYVGALLLLPVPLYCLGGKKLLLNTKLGAKICPVVR